MSQNTVHIDDLLNAGYAGFEPVVPDFMWDNIEAQLDKNASKRGFVWWRVAASVAIIATVAGLVTKFAFIKKTEPTTENQITKDQDHSNIKGSGSNANPTKGDKLQNPGFIENHGIENLNSKSKNSNTHFYSPKITVPKTEEVPNPEVTDMTKELQIENSNAAASLKSFGIRFSPTLEVTDNLGALNNRLSNTILPPTRILGGKFLLGMSVGQSMSATGFDINPNYGNYVHKSFARRMQEGEGLQASLNFSGTLAYRISARHYIFTGVNTYQRRNSLNFNFKDEAPALNSVGNVSKDIFGNYPIKGYLSAGSGVEVNFTGSNTITNVEIPLGWMAQFPIAKGWSIVPTAGMGLGFISLNSNNSTLNYQLLEVEKVNRDWYRKTYVNMNTSAGIYKDLGLRIKWGVNASAGYTLSQMYLPNAPIRPRAFTGGLTTQVIWRLD